MSKKIGLIFFGLALSCLLLEVFLRISSKWEKQFQIPPYMGTTYERWTKFSVYHQPSKVLGYEMVPKSAPFINNLGMIDKEYELKKSKNTYRIIILGDSVTAGGAYTEILEGKLNHRTTKDIEVWNCAVGGYQIDQYLNYLKYKALTYDPDLVLIAFCLNDLGTGIPVIYRTKEGLFESYHCYKQIDFLMNRFLLTHSYLYRLLMVRLELFLRKVFPPQLDMVEVGKSRVAAMQEICKKRKIRLQAVIFPYFKPQKDYFDWEKQQYRAIQTVLKELKLNYLDLHPYFTPYLKKDNLKNLRASPEDYIHPSRESDKIAAAAVYRYLKDKIN